MNTILASTFREIAEESGLQARFNYSGRGMYGKTCPGVTGGLGEFVDFAIHFAEEFGTEVGSEALRNVCTDSMGYDTIFYFPRLEIENDEPEEEEDYYEDED